MERKNEERKPGNDEKAQGCNSMKFFLERQSKRMQ